MAEKFEFKGINTPSIPPKWGQSATLGEKIETALLRFMARLIDWGWKFIANVLVEVFDQSMKIMRPGTERATKDIINEFKKWNGAPPWFKTVIASVEKEEGESSFLLRLVLYGLSLWMMVRGGLRPMENKVNYQADADLRSYLPDVNTTLSLWRFGILPEGDAKNILKQLGVPDNLMVSLYQYARNLPNMGDVIAGKWRGVIPQAEWSSMLKRMGYEQSDIELFTELSKNIPPLSDLIHMLVREAWNDGTSGKFGYDDDYPTDLNEWLTKQGYDPDWGKKYWRAHWTLPSPTQAYEMLHRGLIDDNTLRELLKTADYPSFWREKLQAISYNVFTRVDVRRLVQAGLMNAADALKAYQDMGYKKEDAQKLVDFAVKGISQEERDLTKAEVVGMYVDALTDRGATAQALVKMGYDQQEADAILKMADLDIAKAARTDAVNLAKEQFLSGAIDEASATSKLSAAGLKVQSIDRYLTQWRNAKAAQVRIPTISEAGQFYLVDIITEEQYRELLVKNNVDPDAIEWYIKKVKIGKGEEK